MQIKTGWAAQCLVSRCRLGNVIGGAKDDGNGLVDVNKLATTPRCSFVNSYKVYEGFKNLTDSKDSWDSEVGQWGRIISKSIVSISSIKWNPLEAGTPENVSVLKQVLQNQ